VLEATAYSSTRSPSDDPREQLAERRIGVRVRAAGDGDRGGELRVAEGGEGAADAGHDERQDEGRTRVLVRREAGQDEDARADDAADAECRQCDRAEHPLQAVLAGHLLEEHLDGLDGEELAPRPHPPPPGDRE
jgi:hypothetical protein